LNIEQNAYQDPERLRNTGHQIWFIKKQAFNWTSVLFHNATLILNMINLSLTIGS